MLRVNSFKDVDELVQGKKVFLFDFDGTIAHTERLHLKAFNVVLAKYNIELKEEYLNYIGFSEYEIYKMISEDFNVELDIEKLLAERLEVYLKIVKEYKLKPFPVFNQIFGRYPQMKNHILTSNRKEVIVDILKYWNLLHRFEKIISVTNRKHLKKRCSIKY